MEVIIASPWVPTEWIIAHGHEPRGVWHRALNHGPAVTEGECPVAQALAEMAMKAKDAAAVFPTSCDQMRRAADRLRPGRNSRVFLFNLPATWQTNAARTLYLDEMKRLGRFLVNLGGRTPSNAELAQSTARLNQEKDKLRSYCEVHPGRTGAEAMALFHQAARAPDAAEAQSGPGDRVPIALLGGPIFAPEWPLFDALEAAGGAVAVNALEPGERCLVPPVPLSGEHLTLASLADHYFDNVVDVFRRPNSQLYSWLGPHLQERKVRGIVLWVRLGCDLWRAEAASLREAFSLPVLVLDSHRVGSFTSTTPGARDVNRLTAFIESLK